MRRNLIAAAPIDVEWFLRVSVSDEWRAERFAALVRDIELSYRYINAFLAPTVAESFHSRLGPWRINDEARARELVSDLATRLSSEERDARPLRLSYVHLASPGVIEYKAPKLVTQVVAGLARGFIRVRDRTLDWQVALEVSTADQEISQRAEQPQTAVQERLEALEIARQTASMLTGADRVELAREVVRIAERIVDGSRDRQIADGVVATMLDRATQAARRVGRNDAVVDAVDSYYSLGNPPPNTGSQNH
jgi:hypothetical protein